MQKVHGIEVVEKQISRYYIALEISGTHVGLEVAIPEEEWLAFRTMPISQMAQFLRELAVRCGYPSIKSTQGSRRKKR